MGPGQQVRYLRFDRDSANHGKLLHGLDETSRTLQDAARVDGPEREQEASFLRLCRHIA